MNEQWIRTEMLFGKAAMDRLTASRVAIFGIGGVGGYVVEALARSGIGALDLIDHDRIALSNLNRQILTTRENIGNYKVEEAKKRIHSISPECRVTGIPAFFLPENAEEFDFSSYDYIVDAIDTVTAKLCLIEKAHRAGVPIISAMGAGNKMDPTAFRVADLYETRDCPLARVMRRECRKRGIDSLKVVYSSEKPHKPINPAPIQDPSAPRKDTPGSNAFVPAVAGMILAGEVIRDLIGYERKE